MGLVLFSYGLLFIDAFIYICFLFVTFKAPFVFHGHGPLLLDSLCLEKIRPL